MEKNKDKSKLPQDLIINGDGTATYTVSEEGDINGSYRGVFVFKCVLNPLEALSASRTFRELLGPFGADAGEQDRFTAFALTQLQKRIIKSPPWWKTDSSIQGNIEDLNVISIVLDRAITAEAEYKNRLKSKKEEALEKAKSASEELQKNLGNKSEEEEK